ncbi:MAG: MFS transporter [Promethearchaeota archaeon]
MSLTHKPRELHRGRLVGYCIGYFGFILTDVFRGVFLFQYYVYTINLSSILVSIGIAIRLFIAAISSIMFGVLADNKKPGKLGKRRPFLIYGMPVWVLTCILIWLPPWYCPETNSLYWPTALWLWINLILNALSAMCILSAYSSMFPEQSQTHVNRKKVASMTAFLSIIASGISLLLPLTVQSLLKDPEHVKWWEPSGKVILFYIPLVGGTLAIFGLVLIIITFFSVDESFHNRFKDLETKKKSVFETFRQMAVPAQDMKFRKFLLVGFFTSMAGTFLGILIFPFLTYTLKFRGTLYFIYIIVSFTCKFGWYYIWKKILKKHKLVKTYSLCVMASIFAAFLDLIFLYPFLPFELKIILFVITMGTILGSVYAFNLFSAPLASAIIYESAGKNGAVDLDKGVSEISGAYFGLNNFIFSIAGGIASIMIGLILSGPNQSNSIIITLSLASMGIFYLISLIILRKIEVNEEILDVKPIPTEIK